MMMNNDERLAKAVERRAGLFPGDYEGLSPEWAQEICRLLLEVFDISADLLAERDEALKDRAGMQTTANELAASVNPLLARVAELVAARMPPLDIVQKQTPNSALLPLCAGARRKMLVTIEVSADFENRLDNQWEVEREVHADRWLWKWADDTLI